MNTRFDILYNLPNVLYIQGAPIIIVAGALLKDTMSGSIVAQLKYQSVSDKKISALKIDILPMDVTMQISDKKVEYQYLDLNIRNGQTFGTNKAVIMPQDTTRSFVVSGITVVFSDGEQWSGDGSFISLKQTGNLKDEFDNDEIIKQYQLETSCHAKFIPIEENGLWYCTCGTWNNKSICTGCSLTKTKVFEAYDFDRLKKLMEIRIAEEIEQQDRIKKENELKKKKIKRNIKIVMLILLFIAIILALIGVQPYILRYKVNKTIEKGEYIIALDYIEKIVDEQEASDMYERVKTCMHEEVLKAIDEHNYVLGAELSRTYAEYIDFEECINLVQEICPHENTSLEQKEATCELDGYSIKRWDLCGYEEITNYTAIGHDFSEMVDREPTCEEDGNKHLICNNCGTEKDIAIIKLGHTYEKTVSVQPTCDKVGEYLYTCNKCGDEYTEEIRATGHTYEKTVSVQPTCDKVGEYLYTCNKCGDKYTEVISATGHNFIAPTCTEDGICTTCGSKGENALGHEWGGYQVACTRCSIKYPPNINFVGLPCSGQYSGVTVTEVHAEVERVYDFSTYKTAQMKITVSGVNNGNSSSVYVEFYNSSGEKVTFEEFYIGSGTTFSSVWEYVNLSTDQTYTIKISH